MASEELLVEARNCDLVALGTTSRPGKGRRPLGSTARDTAGSAPCSVFLSRTSLPQGPVVAVAQGNQQSLKFAAKIAKAFDRPLAILALGGSREESRQAGTACQEWARDHDTAAEITTLTLDEEKDLVAALQSKAAGLFVMDRQGPWTNQVRPEALIEQLECPVLLLR